MCQLISQPEAVIHAFNGLTTGIGFLDNCKAEEKHCVKPRRRFDSRPNCRPLNGAGQFSV